MALEINHSIGQSAGETNPQSKHSSKLEPSSGYSHWSCNFQGIIIRTRCRCREYARCGIWKKRFGSTWVLEIIAHLRNISASSCGKAICNFSNPYFLICKSDVKTLKPIPNEWKRSQNNARKMRRPRFRKMWWPETEVTIRYTNCRLRPLWLHWYPASHRVAQS